MKEMLIWHKEQVKLGSLLFSIVPKKEQSKTTHL